MKVSVLVFPGTNCDQDIQHSYGKLLGCDVNLVWHRDHDIRNPDLVVLPGGFSYGDYLRTGALAKLSPAMTEVAKFAKAGGKVLGICNGFQILCEAGLLPGVLLQNANRKFLSQFVSIRVEQTGTFFTSGFKTGDVVRCPIAHGDGNYFADPHTIEELEKEGQVVFRYSHNDGGVNHEDRESNPNGSINSIAGICNKERNVVGLMPHPERAVESITGWVGGNSGMGLLKAALG